MTRVDILLSGGLKWLLGGPGIAYMYVRRDLVPQLSPTVAGWFGNSNQFSFNPHELVFRDDAARFETGTPSVGSVYSGAEGLRIVNELSPEAIRERTSELASHLVTRLRDERFVLRIPNDPEHHASITMVEVEDPQSVVAGLVERDVIVDARPGAVRLSVLIQQSWGHRDRGLRAERGPQGTRRIRPCIYTGQEAGPGYIGLVW